MQHAFVFTEVAVLVRHWFEIDLADSHLEHGARVELRLPAPRPRRGSESAAQEIVIDRPVWRADLFDRLDGTPGAFEAAHFHPHFVGVEPSDRHWADEVTAAPFDWLASCLTDVAGVVAAAGVQLRDPAAVNEQVGAEAAAIVDAARSRAPMLCGTAGQCYAWTRDAEDAVHVMLGSLQRPDLLDRERVSPWLPAGVRG
ncbi:hypothetical protein ACU61A_37750 [Pseudonocardia sichuanensis]|uniref:Uncharacterized protein n=1 Tax=Pseudonocardia kunmingensis TaxID=630975 RepID=A0A543DKZ2_9PSEU|nr:hypothetical protein [Pseudonocardia kunmingensis]TQM10003.1 hypothetical protein FB558_5784 [Pseudonocardia kunmingensis]